MGLEQGSPWEDRIVLALFATITIIFLITGLSGIAWKILDPIAFSFWLVVITFLLVFSSVTVLTYSFVSFTQSREVRHLMLLLMSANIMIWAFLFLLSHPASINWSLIFSERNRNRTMVIAWVLIVIPTILLGSFTGEVKPSRPSVLLLVLWGAVIMPITSLGLFFSRDPVFILVTSEGGIEGMTTTGVIMSIGFMFAQILALPRIMQQWWRTRNTIDLSLMLAMGLWLLGALFGMFAWDPLQVAEIIWMASIIAGFLLIAAVQFVTSILHPHKNLERFVHQRTRELNISKQESEFYLNMWTHKMGNFLQGMITFLDILEMAAQNSEDDTKTRAAASDLSREAAMVNQQVVQLTRIKESLDQALWPVNLPEAFEDAIKSSRKLLGEDVFTAEFIHRESLTVNGDNLLPLAFHSAIAFQVKNRVDDLPHIKVSVGHSDSPRSIEIRSRGKPIPEGLRTFIEGEELRGQIALDLDLFTIKLLMNRYGAKIRCGRDESTEENSCTFTFPSD